MKGKNVTITLTNGKKINASSKSVKVIDNNLYVRTFSASYKLSGDKVENIEIFS